MIEPPATQAIGHSSFARFSNHTHWLKWIRAAFIRLVIGHRFLYRIHTWMLYCQMRICTITLTVVISNLAALKTRYKLTFSIQTIHWTRFIKIVKCWEQWKHKKWTNVKLKAKYNTYIKIYESRIDGGRDRERHSTTFVCKLFGITEWLRITQFYVYVCSVLVLYLPDIKKKNNSFFPL